MKPPVKSTLKKTVPKQTPSKSNAGGFSVNQALQLADRSVEGLKAYADYKKEKEVTKRALIEGERDIRLSEHEVTKAHLLDDQHSRSHEARLVELGNQDMDSQRQHERALTQLQNKADLESRVLKQLESKQITAEEAALLLYGAQE